MKKQLWWIVVSALVISSMILAGCAPAATPAPATEAPKTEAPAATEAPKTEAPAATEAPKTEAPAATEVKTEAPKTEAPKGDGGRIVYIDNSGFYTLNIFRTPWFTQTQSAMYDPMVAPTLELDGYVCVLCKDWEIAKDGKSVTFHLRDDVTFHDGTKMDAEAIKWNYEFYMNPESGAQINSTWKDIFTSFEVVDPYTIKLNMKEPYAALFADLYLTYIASPTAYKELGDEKFGSKPVGTGPFIPVEIVENQHVLYKANPDYKWGPSWSSGQPPKAKEFEIRFNTDQAVSYAALEAGEASYIGLAAQFTEKAKANPDIVINKGVDWGLKYLGWNHTKPIFQNLKFRQAVAHAVDRDEAILAGFEGEAFSIASFDPPSTLLYNEAQNDYAKEQFKYDPELSKKLLDEAGIKDTNNDGVREFEGKNIDLQLSISTSQDVKRVAETIQAQLAEVGIKVNVTPMESATQADMLNKCEQEFFIRAYGLNDPTIMHSLVRLSKNRNCLKDEKADALAVKMDSLMDPAERQKAVDELNKYMVDNVVYIPIWADYLNTAYRTNLKGAQFDKAGNIYIYDAYIE